MNGFIDLKNNEKFTVKDIEKLVTMTRDRMYKDMNKSVTIKEVSIELESLHKEVYNATKDMPRYLRTDWVFNVSKIYNNSEQLLDKNDFMYMCILLVQLYFLRMSMMRNRDVEITNVKKEPEPENESEFKDYESERER